MSSNHERDERGEGEPAEHRHAPETFLCVCIGNVGKDLIESVGTISGWDYAKNEFYEAGFNDIEEAIERARVITAAFKRARSMKQRRFTRDEFDALGRGD